MPKHMNGYLHTPENSHTHVRVHSISGPAEREGKEVVRKTWWEHGGNMVGTLGMTILNP